jgi:hypothetical protein
MNVGIETVAALFLFLGIFVSNFRHFVLAGVGTVLYTKLHDVEFLAKRSTTDRIWVASKLKKG